MKKRLMIAVPVVLIALVAAALFTRSRESIYVGTIEVTKVDISPRVASVIATRPASEGMVFKQGDRLFTLACEDIAVQREKLASEYRRAERLRSAGTVSDEIYEKVKAAHDDNELKTIWCDVRSPLAATVLTTYHEVGEWVTPGVKVLTLGDLNDVWAFVYVDQPMLATLKLGQEVEGFLPEVKQHVKGQIIQINDEAEFTPKNVQTRAERTRLVFGIKIRFDNSTGVLKPGMPIEVAFAKGR